jgi:hypothetical protein
MVHGRRLNPVREACMGQEQEREAVGAARHGKRQPFITPYPVAPESIQIAAEAANQIRIKRSPAINCTSPSRAWRRTAI